MMCVDCGLEVEVDADGFLLEMGGGDLEHECSGSELEIEEDGCE